jgi:Ribbon-helix-helix protein, copG family
MTRSIVPHFAATLNWKTRPCETPPTEDMLLHMTRTTLVLDDALYARLKKRAADDGRTLSETVERALRLGIEALSTGRRGRIKLPSYDLGPFLVDPAQRTSVRGVLAPGEEE